MKNIPISLLNRPIDSDKINFIVDVESTTPKTSYMATVVHKNKRYVIQFVNACRIMAPKVYLRDSNLLILSEYQTLVFDLLNPEAAAEVVPIHFMLQKAFDLGSSVLVTHEIGCTLLTNDMKDVIWSAEGRDVVGCSVENGEVRLFTGQHQSVLIDMATGKEAGLPGQIKFRQVVPDALAVADAHENHTAVILQFPSKRIA